MGKDIHPSFSRRVVSHLEKYRTLYVIGILTALGAEIGASAGYRGSENQELLSRAGEVIGYGSMGASVGAFVGGLAALIGALGEED